jgi:hypothetical protein
MQSMEGEREQEDASASHERSADVSEASAERDRTIRETREMGQHAQGGGSPEAPGEGGGAEDVAESDG